MQRHGLGTQPARCARLPGTQVLRAPSPGVGAVPRPAASCSHGSEECSTSASTICHSSSSSSRAAWPQRRARTVAAKASSVELARLGEQTALMVPPATSGQVYASFRWPAQLGGSEVSVVGEWDNWNTESTLFQTKASGDWVRTLLIPQGSWEYKFQIDGKWRVAPSDPVIHNGQGVVNNKQLFSPNATIEVPARGLFSDVCVVGSWCNWRDILFMERRGDRFIVDLCLHPGQYHYKLLRGSPEDIRVKGLDLWGEGSPGGGRAGAEMFALHEDAPVESLTLEDGRTIKAHKLDVKRPLAFYLFYATGWSECLLHYRLVDEDDDDASYAPWQYMPMDDAPSRAQPAGPTSRWKQAFIPSPRRGMRLEFYISGPAPGGDSSGSDSDDRRRRDREPPREDQVQRKEDRPIKGDGSSVYVLPWPSGWKLQKGTLTKFMRVMEPATLLCSDIDGTMVSDSNDEKEKYWGLVRTAEFQTYWEDNAALAGGVLVYNTGRSKGQLVYLLGERPQLAVPDVCITAVGTKIWYLPEGKRAFSDPTQVEWIEDKTWARVLDEDWDITKVRNAAEDVMNRLNSGRDTPRVQWLDQGREHPHRIALSCEVGAVEEVMSRLADQITKRGVLSRIITSGSGDWRYVDVVAVRAGKLEALEWVRKLYHVPVKRCATAGDSCNDILMLDGRMPAIIVGNAQKELVDWYHRQNDEGRIVLTDKSDAAGVLEGLARHRLM